jgi:hypothetical protein
LIELVKQASKQETGATRGAELMGRHIEDSEIKAQVGAEPNLPGKQVVVQLLGGADVVGANHKHLHFAELVHTIQATYIGATRSCKVASAMSLDTFYLECTPCNPPASARKQ